MTLNPSQIQGQIATADSNIQAFEMDARDYAQANGVHVEIARDSVGTAARFNRGFPNGITPFSPEAKAWMQSSPSYADQQTRWHRIVGERGC